MMSSSERASFVPEDCDLGLNPFCVLNEGMQFLVDVTRMLIPVVTFLAPLASNFEGLKDR